MTPGAAPDASSQLDVITAGYAFTGPALELGAVVIDGTAHPEALVRIPLSALNRHGLVAGATGTGKTKTLQLMAEQLSAAGVPVFLADIKGDLSGLAAPGEPSDRTTQRATEVGQTWVPTAYPVEFLSLGGTGAGTPVRATITSFGPVLLSKVLGLNGVQESSLGLIFHFADSAGLPLLDLKDLRAVVQYLSSDEGKGDLKDLGGLSSATAGVILRQLIALSDAGADPFFGEPEFDTQDLLRTTSDGRGIVTCLELPSVQDKPVLFSTFLMWTFTLTNTGSTTLSTLTVSDPTAGAVTCPVTTLAPGASTLCTADAKHVITQADVDAGEVSNTATAHGTDPANTPVTSNPSSTDTALAQVVGLRLVKKGTPTDTNHDGRIDAGDHVAWTFTLTNTGLVTLHTITIADPKAGPVTCVATTLAPGASTTCSADNPYTITTAEANAGIVHNTATATGSCGCTATVKAVHAAAVVPTSKAQDHDHRSVIPRLPFTGAIGIVWAVRGGIAALLLGGLLLLVARRRREDDDPQTAL